MILLSRLILLSLVLLLINACSSLSKSECVQGDWRSIGFDDAAKGSRAETKLNQHSRACSKHKINPDNKVYYSGYAEGLKTFCTQNTGFKFGGIGREYLDTCPASLKPTFISGYISGLDVAINNIDNDIDDLRFERRRRDRRLASLENQRSPKKRDKNKDLKNNNKDDESLNKINLYKSQLNSLRNKISSKRSRREELIALRVAWSHSHSHTH